ncbi:plasma alpha-L-fucosidase isoform X2 [Loxodonta africana]|uniref:plasma alpha-L-fucosidase isoform X2 n=1 Tax=Loxodonta africana TaxID=9785 RepID=UPI0030CE5BCD
MQPCGGNWARSVWTAATPNPSTGEGPPQERLSQVTLRSRFKQTCGRSPRAGAERGERWPARQSRGSRGPAASRSRCCCCCCPRAPPPAPRTTSPPGSRWTAARSRPGSTKPSSASSSTGACTPCPASGASGSGFTLWGSQYSWNWNAVDEGPKRDIVKELEVAIRNRTALHFGLYYSLFEWFNPLFLEDQFSSFHKRQFPVSKMLPELYELVNNYQPELLWADGDGGAPDSYWNSTGFLAWLYNESPVRDIVVTNDRWGAGTICKHGGYYTCQDRYHPGHIMPHKWENCMTIDKVSWGYRRNAGICDYFTIEELVKQLVETVSCGGNLLMNIGPTRDGIISPIFEERLRQMGTWLSVNGEAIYGTHTWRSPNDTVTPDVWYTFKPKENLVYAIFLKWPTSGYLFLGEPKAIWSSTMVKLLGHGQPLNWTSLEPSGIVVKLPQLTISQLPCQWGWTLSLTNVI